MDIDRAAVITADPDPAPGIFIHAEDFIIQKSVVAGDLFKMMSIEPADTPVCAKPHEPPAVLKDIVYRIAGQSILGSIVPELGPLRVA